MLHNSVLDKMMEGKRVEDVDSVEAFLVKYCRPERYLNRDKDYKASVLAHNRANVFEAGYTFLNEFDSTEGRVVSYFPCYRA